MTQDNRLPIYEIQDSLLEHLKQDSRLVITAPTGSGKSTQVPQMLLDNGVLEKGQVVILQPRRLAARMLAQRVAFERQCRLGDEVGYQIRFENVTSDATRIRFITEGILLRQIIQDPKLKGVQTLIFDEFHERHLYGDITLARALDLQQTSRPDLKILVMSATLDSTSLAEYLAPCQLLNSEGRTFPVDIRYLLPGESHDSIPIWDQAAEAFSNFVRLGGEGDVLVFMPGGYEIQKTLEAFRHTSESRGYILLPLHGELPSKDQDAAVSRYDQPKIVVATNVAETSLTIDGIRLVIDSGFARIPRYDPYRGINTLLVEKISQASSDQRAGRAGRTGPGICMRLWTEREHEQRPVQELPEVQRLDLSEVILSLKAAGVKDLKGFRWLEPPDDKRLYDAIELLTDLGGLDHKENITELGKQMLAFPLHPRYARMLLAAEKLGCVYQAALIAALTQGRDILIRKVDRATRELREEFLSERSVSDCFMLMRAWSYASKNNYQFQVCKKLGIHAQSARQVKPLLEHFLRIAKKEGLDVAPKTVDDEVIQKCILLGFSDRLAIRMDGGTLRCELVHGRRGVLARESVVHHANMFVAAEIREIGNREGEVQTILSLATEIEEAWLKDYYPDDFDTSIAVVWDPSSRRVYAASQETFRGLMLTAKRVDPPPEEPAARLLAEKITDEEIGLKHWDAKVEQWILRLNLLAEWCPEFELPAIDEDARRHLIESICMGAFSYKEIKERPVLPALKQWLNAAQREIVDKHAPERITLSNGKTPKVVYSKESAPCIALRIQELYEVKQLPKVALQKVAVAAQILAPNMRPVQITQDLESFWRDHYPSVKKELQRKYPKHAWR
ncbi:ATP-dependent helicase HrpB [Verrucomicrobia bacterium]|nr:ATP-dependent helicase HrpB [Verrucomicrobiota bacterium]MDA7652930.1 ATP-dependent helicase HrpB [bacterium]